MEGGWYRSWKTVRSANTGACHHPISRIGPGPSPWAVCPSHDTQYSELRHVDSTFGTLQPRDEGGVGYKGALIVFHHSGLPFANVVLSLVVSVLLAACRICGVDWIRLAGRRRASNTNHGAFIHNKRRLFRLGAYRLRGGLIPCIPRLNSF